MQGIGVFAERRDVIMARYGRPRIAYSCKMEIDDTCSVWRAREDWEAVEGLITPGYL